MLQLGTYSLTGVAIYGNSTRRYGGNYYWNKAYVVIFKTIFNSCSAFSIKIKELIGFEKVTGY
jgi:hypothetical protein